MTAERQSPQTAQPTASEHNSAPLAELGAHLAEDLKLLARQEAALAKSELSEGINQAKVELVGLALSGAALAAGGLVLLTAAVLALALVMPAWSAALVVGLVVSLLGAVLLVTSKAKLSQLKLKPERAFENVAKDLTTIKKAAT